MVVSGALRVLAAGLEINCCLICVFLAIITRSPPLGVVVNMNQQRQVPYHCCEAGIELNSLEAWWTSAVVSVERLVAIGENRA